MHTQVDHLTRTVGANHTTPFVTMQTDYQVISQGNLRDLTDLVKKSQTNNWQTAGGVMVTRNAIPDNGHGYEHMQRYSTTYHQAMVKFQAMVKTA